MRTETIRHRVSLESDPTLPFQAALLLQREHFKTIIRMRGG